MPPSSFPRNEPDGTREAIMQATYRALCEHGYADLTIQRIGDEFEKSKSLLYHHYDGKDDLLVEFLAYVLERFEATVREEYGPGSGDPDPADHLRAILDRALPATLDDERAAFFRALVELRAQAAHDPEYRDHFTRSDRLLHRHVADVVRRGVEDGTFRDVEPEQVARLLVTAIDGAMVARATTDDDGAVPAVRAALETYLREHLLAEGR